MISLKVLSLTVENHVGAAERRRPHRQVRLSFSATAVLDVRWPATCSVSGSWEIHDPFRGDSGSHHRIVFLFLSRRGEE